MKSNWPVLDCQLYISTASLGLRAPASSVVCSQTASLQNQPAAPGEPSILLRLLFFLLTHIHPAWSTCQTLNIPPPFLLHPLTPPLHPPSSASLGLWRWASPQWHSSTDCNASSSKGGCSLVNTHVKSGCAALVFLFFHLLFGYFCLLPHIYLWASNLFSLHLALRSAVLDHDWGRHKLLHVSLKCKTDKERTPWGFRLVQWQLSPNHVSLKSLLQDGHVKEQTVVQGRLWYSSGVPLKHKANHFW